MFLVVVGRHWVVVQGSQIADNHEGITNLDDTKHKRKRVNRVYEIRGSLKRLCDAPDLPELPKKKWKPSKDYLWIKSFCAKAGYRVSEILNTRAAARGELTEMNIPDGFRFQGATSYHVESLKEAVEVLKSIEPVDELEQEMA